MNYEHEFEIAFKKPYALNHIHTLRFKSPDPNLVDELVRKYGNEDIVFFLNKFLSLFPKSKISSDVSSLSEDELREEFEKLLSINQDLEDSKQSLENQISQLSKSQDHAAIQDLRREREKLSRDLSNEREKSSQYYQDYLHYKNVQQSWIKLFSDFRTLEELSQRFNLLKTDNEKIHKKNQALVQQVKDIDQELQDAKQKLALATARLRSVNTHSELVGGGSHTDKLKNDFVHLKSSLHDVSGKILNAWREQGSKFDFRSEEFLKIKSILSHHIFSDGMSYFTQSKAKVDDELHIIMDTLSDIEDFRTTPIILEVIQRKIKAGLLHSKGVDYSDEAVQKHVELTTIPKIALGLKEVANLEITDEVLDEIKKFAYEGFVIVQEIVNDPSSGELFIPKNGADFDDSLYETRDDHQGKIKMTLYAGYRIQDAVLVKADVVTYQHGSPSPKNPESPEESSGNGVSSQESAGDMDTPIETQNSSISDPKPDPVRFPAESGCMIHTGNTAIVEEADGKENSSANPEDSCLTESSTSESHPDPLEEKYSSRSSEAPSQDLTDEIKTTLGSQDSSISTFGPNSSSPLEEEEGCLAENSDDFPLDNEESEHKALDFGDNNSNLEPSNSDSLPKNFSGKVTRSLNYRSRPQKDARTVSDAAAGLIVNFEGWTIGEPWKKLFQPNLDDRWYKVSGQDWWLPAYYIEIEGELPSHLEIKQDVGGTGEDQ